MGKTATASERAKTIYSLQDPDQRQVLESDLNHIMEGPPPVLVARTIDR